MKLNYTRVAQSLAVLTTVVLAGGTASRLASAAPDDPLSPAPVPCYWVDGVGGRCVPACHGHVPTVAVPPGGAPFYAPSGPQVIIGTSGGDNINADDDDDVICGQGGIDVIRGGDGADLIYGEDDADQIYGELGNDTIWGGDGGDVIDGQEGDDTI